MLKFAGFAYIRFGFPVKKHERMSIAFLMSVYFFSIQMLAQLFDSFEIKSCIFITNLFNFKMSDV